MKLIERGVNQKEVRYIKRALRCIQSLRKKTNDAILRRVTVAYYPACKFTQLKDIENNLVSISIADERAASGLP